MNEINLIDTGINLIGNGINLIADRDQFDPLPIEVPIKDTNKKIPNSDLTIEERYKNDLLSLGVNYDDLPE
jgi:hypothetical protein